MMSERGVIVDHTTLFRSTVQSEGRRSVQIDTWSLL